MWYFDITPDEETPARAEVENEERPKILPTQKIEHSGSIFDTLKGPE